MANSPMQTELVFTQNPTGFSDAPDSGVFLAPRASPRAALTTSASIANFDRLANRVTSAGGRPHSVKADPNIRIANRPGRAAKLAESLAWRAALETRPEASWWAVLEWVRPGHLVEVDTYACPVAAMRAMRVRAEHVRYTRGLNCYLCVGDDLGRVLGSRVPATVWDGGVISQMQRAWREMRGVGA